MDLLDASLCCVIRYRVKVHPLTLCTKTYKVFLAFETSLSTEGCNMIDDGLLVLNQDIGHRSLTKGLHLLEITLSRSDPELL